MTEWTQALCKFLREQLQKLAEHHHSSISLNSGGAAGGSSVSSSSSSGNANSTMSNLSTGGTASSGSNLGSNSLNGVTVEVAYKQWQYCTQLARHLYEVLYPFLKSLIISNFYIYLFIVFCLLSNFMYLV